MEEDEIIYDSPEYYYNLLSEMYLDDDEMDISSDFEARATLVKLNKLEKDLDKLKLTISTDMRTIRNLFLNETIIEKPKFLGLFRLEKKLSKTQKRKKLLFEREKALKPYKELIEIIEEYVLQIDDLRKYIQKEFLETFARSEYTRVTKKIVLFFK